MKLYLIGQTENKAYDTYDSAVVCAENTEQARNISPADGKPVDWTYALDRGLLYSWCTKPENVSVKEIGTAKRGTPAGLILASFNAG